MNVENIPGQSPMVNDAFFDSSSSVGSFVSLLWLLYSHHGIYAREGTVIHFKGEDKEKRDPAVMLTEIESFLNGGKLRRRNYQERLPHSESLRIAREHLSEKGYSLPFNNCEHFATYCATGKKKSKQVRRAFGSVVTITIFASCSFILKAITRRKQG